MGNVLRFPADSVDNLAVHVGEPELSALITERQAPVVDAAQVQKCCLHIVYVHWVGRDVPTEIVGLAVDSAWFDAGAGKPPAKRSTEVIEQPGVNMVGDGF